VHFIAIKRECFDMKKIIVLFFGFYMAVQIQSRVAAIGESEFNICFVQNRQRERKRLFGLIYNWLFSVLMRFSSHLQGLNQQYLLVFQTLFHG
jgi:hypothetical protein